MAKRVVPVGGTARGVGRGGPGREKGTGTARCVPGPASGVWPEVDGETDVERVGRWGGGNRRAQKRLITCGIAHRSGGTSCGHDPHGDAGDLQRLFVPDTSREWAFCDSHWTEQHACFRTFHDHPGIQMIAERYFVDDRLFCFTGHHLRRTPGIRRFTPAGAPFSFRRYVAHPERRFGGSTRVNRSTFPKFPSERLAGPG